MRLHSLSGSVLLVLVACVGSARAAEEWGRMPVKIAAPMARIQGPAGNFRIGGRVSPYGNAALGYALIQTGLDHHRPAWITQGLRGVNAALLRARHANAFQTLALASAYNLIRAERPRHRSFRRIEPRWKRWMRRQKPHWLPRNVLYNQRLVELLGDVELLHTGVKSSRRGTVLSRAGRRQVTRLITRVVDEQLPAAAPGSRPFVLSDRPGTPLAYGALMFGMYARAVSELDSPVGSPARRLLKRMALGEYELMGPDGDAAYFGRSQEESWAQSLIAVGAGISARLFKSDRAFVADMLALRTRSLTRLRDRYVAHPGLYGMSLVPNMQYAPRPVLAALDYYANVQDYTGLTLLSLNWALDAPPAGRQATGAIAADADFGAVLGTDEDEFAVIRSGATWFSVKKATSKHVCKCPTTGPDDQRYDQGLMTMKILSGGAWRDVVPVRPLVGKPVSLGPVLLGPGGGLFVGQSIAASNGQVTIGGAFGARAATLRYVPTDSGVRLEIPVHPGDRLEWSTYFRGDKPPTQSGTTLTGPGMRVDTNVPFTLGTAAPVASAARTDARALVTRADLTFQAVLDQTIEITITAT